MGYREGRGDGGIERKRDNPCHVDMEASKAHEFPHDAGSGRMPDFRQLGRLSDASGISFHDFRGHGEKDAGSFPVVFQLRVTAFSQNNSNLPQV